jgi:hypothetical protein
MKTLLNQQAFEFLKLYGVRVLDYSRVNNPKDVYDCKPPFVLKANSSHIHNKEDKNLVRFVNNLSEVDKHWNDIRKYAQVVKQNFHEGHKFIIQIVRSAGANPAIIVGLSGLSVDFHKDFVERKCPLSETSARRMIKKLCVYNHIDTHNNKPTKLKYLENTLVKLSELAVSESELIALEVDPFILSDKSGKVVDVKVVLENG